MKWHAQVAHVARKDLQRVSALIVAYVGVVATATAAAVEWIPFGATFPMLWMFFLVLLGMIFFALLVQADSPSRSNAFWMILPLRPSAVFSAKILVALLLLLALPLLGQIAGLLAHDVAARDIPGLLVESALSYGMWLGLAAAIAALTPDLRTFIVALVLVTLGWLIGMQAVWFAVDSSTGFGSVPPLLVPSVIVGGTLLVLAHQYLTRDVRRGVWIAGVLLGAGLLFPLMVPRSGPVVIHATGAVPEGLRPVTLAIEEIRLEAGSIMTLLIRFEGASEFHQYALASPVVHLRMPDGSASEVEIRDSYLVFDDPVVRLGDEFEWLGERQRAGIPVHGISFSAELSLPQREVLAQGSAQVTLRGHIEVREPRVVLELPLEVGATTAWKGKRIRIAGVERAAEGPSVEMRISSVSSSRAPEDPRRGYRSGARSSAYALVNRNRREAIVMRESRSSGRGFGLVLPGPRTQTEMTWIGPRHDRMPGVPLVEEWLRHTHLLLIDWVPSGSYPLIIEGISGS